jgi:hypothetical protein
LDNFFVARKLALSCIHQFTNALSARELISDNLNKVMLCGNDVDSGHREIKATVVSRESSPQRGDPNHEEAISQIQAPAPVPHPDDIIIDVQTGSVRVTGPMTREEKALWDQASEHRAKALEEVAKLKAILESEPDHQQHAEMEAEIKYVEDAFRKVDEVSRRQWRK